MDSKKEKKGQYIIYGISGFIKKKCNKFSGLLDYIDEESNFKEVLIEKNKEYKYGERLYTGKVKKKGNMNKDFIRRK